MLTIATIVISTISDPMSSRSGGSCSMSSDQEWSTSEHCGVILKAGLREAIEQLWISQPCEACRDAQINRLARDLCRRRCRCQV